MVRPAPGLLMQVGSSVSMVLRRIGGLQLVIYKFQASDSVGSGTVT